MVIVEIEIQVGRRERLIGTVGRIMIRVGRVLILFGRGLIFRTRIGRQLQRTPLSSTLLGSQVCSMTPCQVGWPERIWKPGVRRSKPVGCERALAERRAERRSNAVQRPTTAGLMMKMA